jgi:hypothetical protein
MDDLSQWIKQKTGTSRSRGLPWWAWALAVTGALSVLIGWLIRKRAVQTAPERQMEGLPFPKVRVAANTPVENISPSVQEIPLPG